MAPFGLKNSHLKMHFALNFALCKNFAPCFARCENWLEVYENGTRVPGVDFALCENFRTLNSGVRKWLLGNFAPWNQFSHLEINFAPCFWGVRKWLPLDRGIRTLKWGVRNFHTLKSGVRNSRTLKCNALFPWFFSPVLLLKSSPHFSWFFSEIYHQNWLKLRQNKLRLRKK